MMFTPLIFLFICYKFCRGSGIELHRTESFQYLAILSEQTTTHADTGKLRLQGNGNVMTPKDCSIPFWVISVS